MTFKYRYRKQIIIGILIFIILGSGGFFLFQELHLKKEPKKEETLLTLEKKESKKTIQKKEEKEEEKTNSQIMVDVKGEVVNPGIYTLDKEKRVIDAIQMAGGLTSQANTSVLNLSKKLTDEMVIIVYSHYQVENFAETKEKEELVNQECVKGVNALENDACIESKDTASTPTGKISLNTATVEELMQLEGIGEAKAKSIIEYREASGPFQSIEDIKNVSGIGDSLFDKIKENITL